MYIYTYSNTCTHTHIVINVNCIIGFCIYILVLHTQCIACYDIPEAY